MNQKKLLKLKKSLFAETSISYFILELRILNNSILTEIITALFMFNVPTILGSWFKNGWHCCIYIESIEI